MPSSSDDGLVLPPPPAVSPFWLQSAALKESLRQYVSSGVRLSGSAASGPGKSLERLARELAALSVVGNSSFASLSTARLAAMYGVAQDFEAQLRKLRSSSSSAPLLAKAAVAAAAGGSSSSFSSSSSSSGGRTTAAAVQSSVTLLLGLLEAAAKQQPDVLLQLLHTLAPTITPSHFGELASPTEGVHAVLDDSMQQFSSFLCRVAASPAAAVGDSNRTVALEAMVHLAICRADLLGALRAVHLMLGRCASGDDATLRVRPGLAALSTALALRDAGAPSISARLSDFQLPDLRNAEHVAVATDGAFLYVHADVCGLLKVSLGVDPAAGGRGVVVNRASVHPAHPATMAFVNGRLLFRSIAVLPAFAVCIDVDTLSITGSLTLLPSDAADDGDNAAPAAVAVQPSAQSFSGLSRLAAVSKERLSASSHHEDSRPGFNSVSRAEISTVLTRIGVHLSRNTVVSMLSTMGCQQCGSTPLAMVAANGTWRSLQAASLACDEYVRGVDGAGARNVVVGVVVVVELCCAHRPLCCQLPARTPNVLPVVQLLRR